MTTHQNTPSFEEELRRVLDGFGIYSRWLGYDEANGTVGAHTSMEPSEAIDAASEQLIAPYEAALTRQREELAAKLESIRARLVMDRNKRVADSLAISELDTLIQTMKGEQS